MIRSVFYAVVCLSVVGSIGLASPVIDPGAPEGGLVPVSQYRDGYLMVRFREKGVGPAYDQIRQNVLVQAGGGTIVKMYKGIGGLALVQLPAGVTVADAVNRFSASGGIEYAEPDYRFSIQAVPNDTRFGEMWGLNNTGQTGGTENADIDAPEAWDIHTGSRDIIVAVVDTGVDYTHPDLRDNLWINQAEMNGLPNTDDDGNGFIDDIYGYDFYGLDSDPLDDNLHGTHVSGTIGAVGNNNIGVAGICWNTRIMAVKVMGANGSGYLSSIVDGVTYAVNNGAKVINASLGAYGGGAGGLDIYIRSFYDAIDYADAHDVLFVCSAGNDAMDNDSSIWFPASYNLPNMLSVMATDHFDQPANFTHWGKNMVDLGAPGVDILSTFPTYLTGEMMWWGFATDYETISGTSMASPHVAGACALVWSAKPTLKASEVKSIILSTVDPLDSLEDLCVTEGRLNIFKALQKARAGDGLPPTPNPSQWLIEPTATGPHHLVMKAVKATDPSGVEYFFDCIAITDADGNPVGNPDDYDSGWQSSELYRIDNAIASRKYTFRFCTRDLSANRNQSLWSDELTTETCAAGEDLAPAPNPTKWKAPPRVFGSSKIVMEAVESYDENDVEYFFDCIHVSEGVPGTYDSGWQAEPSYQVTVPSTTTIEYTFVAYVRQKNNRDPELPASTYITKWTEPVKVGSTSVTTIREVGVGAYPTIQSAIDAANDGDTVRINPKVYRETNISFRGKAIKVTSINPKDPAVVAATVIDCEDIWDFYATETRRAFLFQNGEGPDSVLEGITIRNATAIDDQTYFDGQHWNSGAYIDPVTGKIKTYGVDGDDAYGGAIYIGYKIPGFPDPAFPKYPDFIGSVPASPTILNCVFENCSALGLNGSNGGSPPAPRQGDGSPGARGGWGGNAYGGAIFCVQGSKPRIENCSFVNCRAVGGNAGNGGNGSNAGGHPESVEDARGYRGGDGGDAGKGGCAWGGAIYFESDCEPNLINVTITNCLVQVGEAGRGGNGGTGGNGKGNGPGGQGGNGGIGGDLRAGSASGGAVFIGDRTRATLENCRFEDCRIVAVLSGDYSGGNGGNGGNGSGETQPGGVGGNGGPAYYIPDKFQAIGGVTARGGTGGVGGNGTGGFGRAMGGNGGFRLGIGGGESPDRGLNFDTGSSSTGIWPIQLPEGSIRSGGLNTGIWPSNLYYLAYYWEDTTHIDNPVSDPNLYIDYLFDLLDISTADISVLEELMQSHPELFESHASLDYVWDAPISWGLFEDIDYFIDYVTQSRIFNSSYTPFYGIVNFEYQIAYPKILDPEWDPNSTEPETYIPDREHPILLDFIAGNVTPLTPKAVSDPNYSVTGACGGANYYGKNSVITLRNCRITGNTSFANHGGGEFYDQGCRAIIENCTYEDNSTAWVNPDPEAPSTPYALEGYGGALFADQPTRMKFKDCTFTFNNAFAGGGLYCNFSPSVEQSQVLNLTGCLFQENRADYDSGYSYAGGVYVGNTLEPYEEFYFNNFSAADPWGDPYSVYDERYYDELLQFISSEYAEHGMIVFRWVMNTSLWAGCTEVDNLLNRLYAPRLRTSVAGCTFENNLSIVGGGLCAEGCLVNLRDTDFTGNLARIGGGSYLYASDVTARDNRFYQNQGTGSFNGNGVDYLNIGGGMYIYMSDVFFTGNRFAANKTEGFAGGLYLNGASLSGADQQLVNNLFVENTASLGAGGLAAYGGSNVVVRNCNFIDNWVWDEVTDLPIGAGGGILAIDSTVDTINSIFRGNAAIYGPQICVGDPLLSEDFFTAAAVGYSMVEDGEDGLYTANGAYLWFGSNSTEDPKFIQVTPVLTAMDRTFYLSQTAAGQIEDSPCLNKGSGTAASLESLIGCALTTQTDHGEADAGTVDIGYHYVQDKDSVADYMLTIQVYYTGVDPHGKLKDPLTGAAVLTGTYPVKQGKQFELEALPDAGYRVKRWIGMDDDTSFERTNIVTCDRSKTVQVEFELVEPHSLIVPSEEYPTLAVAVALARDKDRIILAPRPNEPYMVPFIDEDEDGIGDGLNLQYNRPKGKEIKKLTITSEDPNDPWVVASTILDVGASRYNPSRAFTFNSGEGADIVIEGLTIRNGFVVGKLGGQYFTGIFYPDLNGDGIRDEGDGPYVGFYGEDAVGDGYGGAVLCANGSSPTFRNCVFQHCTVTGGYGGDGAHGMSYEDVIGSDDDGQTGGDGGSGMGNGYGGAIACLGGSSPRIEGCKFLGNMARGGCAGNGGNGGHSGPDGGYGSWGGWGGNAIGDGIGGAIYAEAGCSPQILKCEFEDNLASVGVAGTGGRQGAGDNYPEPYNIFSDGWAGTMLSTGRTGGGAIRYGTGATARVEQCRFLRNTSYEDVTETLVAVNDVQNIHTYAQGGAILVQSNCDVQIRESEFIENMGGAIWFEDGAKRIRIEDCVFKYNGAYDRLPQIDYLRYIDTEEFQLVAGDMSNPAGIYIGRDCVGEGGDPNVVIKSTQFLGHYSLGNGGAIDTDSDLLLIDCDFAGNEALRGGAVYCDKVPLYPEENVGVRIEMSRCTFSDNLAYRLGGGGYFRTTDLSLDTCWIMDNRAQSGGGLFMTYNGRLTVDNSLFVANRATGNAKGYRTVTGEGLGGAVAIVNSPFVICNSRFVENRAEGGTGAGGAIGLYGNDEVSDQRIDNCLFNNNFAEVAGGSVAAKIDAGPQFTNCTFANGQTNGYGGGVFVGQGCTATVSNSIFSRCRQAAVYEESPSGQAEVSYSLFYSNPHGDFHDGQTGQIYSAQLIPGGVSNFGGNPLFVSGPLDGFYLQQGEGVVQSPAVDAGSYEVGYPLSTMTTAPGGEPDSGQVDLGYHYPNTAALPGPFTLTASVQYGKGTVKMKNPEYRGDPGQEEWIAIPGSTAFYCGQMIELKVEVNPDYLITGWSGGTVNDCTRETTNRVVMTSDKNIVVQVRMPNVLMVGGSSEYDSLGDAIEDAEDGDIIRVAPGVYQSETNLNMSTPQYISFLGKNLKVIGFNPDDPTTVRSTVFDHYGFQLVGLGPDSLIEGITLRQSRMLLERSNLTIRNVHFVSCNWASGDSPPPEQGCALDGLDGGCIEAGALEMRESSPRIIGCVFEDNSATGGNGSSGNNGCNEHPNGGDGGWGGWAYGGAVYCGFSSKPVFEGCTFLNNLVRGGNGGNGGNGNANPQGYGGRGGSWMYPDHIEDSYFRFNTGRNWDGWNTWPTEIGFDRGRKYNEAALYYDLYDWGLFAKWFEIDTTQYSSWQHWLENWSFDPYDAYYSAWRYGAYGGAVYCAYNSDATFKGCIFEGNRAIGGLSGVGGANNFGYPPEPDRQLNLPNAGGAVYAAFDCDLVFEDCVIRNNTSDRTTVEVPHTLHKAFGGGIAYEFDCTAKFINCTMNENTAADGGAVWANESVTNIVDCNVADNEAYIGAGLYLNHRAASVVRTQFNANRAKTPDVELPPDDDEEPDQGGDEEPVVPVASLTDLGQGGGFFAENIDLDLRDSIFRKNFAMASGGGLLLSDIHPNGAAIKNCLFDRNLAGRDGAGASIYWYARPTISNCTFVGNNSYGGYSDNLGSGGGLYLAYHSNVVLTDSIFWNNLASQGPQIMVGSGYEFDPRPSSLSVSYCDIQGGEMHGIYRGADCTLEYLSGNINADPLFEADRFGERLYYLNQDSPCVDAGSRSSQETGLYNYTTSRNHMFDRGIVDLGYHYPLMLSLPCGETDLNYDGIIELADLAYWVSWIWQQEDACVSPTWCGGADINKDSYVDLLDYSFMASCWLDEDREAPTSAWIGVVEGKMGEVNPVALPDSIDTVSVRVKAAHDNWTPDHQIKYFFDCLNCSSSLGPVTRQDTYTDLGLTAPPGKKNTDLILGYDEDPNYLVAGLSFLREHEWQVRVRDGRGNESVITYDDGETSRWVTAGKNYIPNPNPPLWAIQPYAVSQSSISMRAMPPYAQPNVPGVDVVYTFVRNPGNLMVTQYNNPEFTDSGLLVDVDYTYMFYIYYSREGVITKSTALSAPVTVRMAEADMDPPTPRYPQWEEFPYQYVENQIAYHEMVAAEHVDPSGPVEYRFFCVELPEYSSDWTSLNNTQADGNRYYDLNGRRYRFRVNAPVALTWYFQVRDAYNNGGDPTDPEMRSSAVRIDSDYSDHVNRPIIVP